MSNNPFFDPAVVRNVEEEQQRLHQFYQHPSGPSVPAPFAAASAAGPDQGDVRAPAPGTSAQLEAPVRAHGQDQAVLHDGKGTEGIAEALDLMSFGEEDQRGVGGDRRDSPAIASSDHTAVRSSPAPLPPSGASNPFEDVSLPTSQPEAVGTAPLLPYRPAPTTSSGVGDPAARPSSSGQATPRPRPPTAVREQDPAQWLTKDIKWDGRRVKIITQNENGPCSLIALCNILLLRGLLEITPADRPVVSYDYLSSLLADYLLTRLSAEPDPSLDLSAALSVLPRTQHGLDVNVRFASHDAFAPLSADDQAEAGASEGELALFKLCDVPLVHGWLADPSDHETWDALVGEASDYNRAVQMVVEGDEVAKGLVVVGDHGDGPGQAEGLGRIQGLDDRTRRDSSKSWTEEEQTKVANALKIKSFLDSTSTQLTYHGLIVLSSSLPPGSLAALFRNSHVSVVYRRKEGDSMDAINPAANAVQPPPGTSAAGSASRAGPETTLADGAASSNEAAQMPTLYTLVTDSAFVTEEEIVWESLVDVDGSGGEFFDSRLRRSALAHGDYVGRSASRRARGVPTGPGSGRGSVPAMPPPDDGFNYGQTEEGGGEDADYALAYQLQQEEDAQEARRQREEDGRRVPSSSRWNSRRTAPSAAYANHAQEQGPRAPNVEGMRKKKGCAIM